jgi:hypothetical protein
MDTLKRNNLKLYGVEYSTQLESMQQKSRQTKLKKYGTLNFTDKSRKTTLEKYGTLNFSDISKQTKLEKYGTLNFNDKSNQTKLEKYGTLNFSDKSNQTKLEKYGNISIHNLRASYSRLQEKYKDEVTFNFDVSTYTGAKNYKLYSFICKHCNSTFDDNLTNGTVPICRTCTPIKSINKSSEEFEIIEFIRSVYTGEIIHGDTTILEQQELDIYIPEFNLAIEVDGVYWHSERKGKDKQYHINKTNKCLDKGVKLLHILDYEWNNKQNIVQSIILHELNKTKCRLFARQCKIQLITPTVCNSFLDTHHLQGADKSSVRLGLFYNNTLVSVMTFCKPRFSKQYQWELSRYTSNINHIIVGGAAKLYKYFIKQYNPINVISYSDKRWFTGSVYSTIGFIRVCDTPPAYSYIKSGKLYNRVTFQKHKLSKILETYDGKLTEGQNMQNNGYDRIWDCGHHKFVWNSNNV